MAKKTDQTLKHIAIICDGNRRWARNQGLDVWLGHRNAVENVFEPLIDRAIERDIGFLTFWIFSTQNWSRDAREVRYLMDLFREFFDTQIERLHEKNVRVHVIGDTSKLEQDIQERIERGMALTRDNTAIMVTLGINYGGRDELRRCVQELAAEVRSGSLEPDAITEERIASHLDTGKVGIPDPDLIVRTSGEQRLSGFLLWQMEYAEYYFPEWHFPEFSPEKLDECIDEFAHRQRRFGGG